jgi:hypothetical protein
VSNTKHDPASRIKSQKNEDEMKGGTNREGEREMRGHCLGESRLTDMEIKSRKGRVKDRERWETLSSPSLLPLCLAFEREENKERAKVIVLIHYLHEVTQYVLCEHLNYILTFYLSYHFLC